MFLALSRGVPEAGLIFAVAMMAGVGATLALVATATVLARQWIVSFIELHGRPIDSVSRLLEALTGVALVAIGLPRTVVLTRKPRHVSLSIIYR